jgi:esterase
MSMILHTRIAGEAERTVVLLHGLLGLGSNLGAIARALAQQARVISPDLRNHGQSFRAPGMQYRELAADLARTLDALGVERAALLGHSMGGKLAMQFALDYPQRCERLLVADIAPVAYAAHHGPVFDALEAIALCPEADRRETARLLEERLRNPALVSLLLMHRERVADGSWAWRLGLREIIEGYPAILAPPASGSSGDRWDGPALFLRGERSDYVQPVHQSAILGLFPRAVTETLSGAGHWLHAEAPDRFIPRACAFLLG